MNKIPKYKFPILIYGILLCVVVNALVSCKEIQDRILDKPKYEVKYYDDGIYITIPWYEPVSYSAVVYPPRFSMEEVIKETFALLQQSSPNNSVRIKVAFYRNTRDKYGNLYRELSIYNLLEVNTSEVKKYRNYIYFENEYDIEGKISVLHNFSPQNTLIKPYK